MLSLRKLGTNQPTDRNKKGTADSAQRRGSGRSFIGSARVLLLMLVLGCMAGTLALLPKVPGSAPLHAIESLRSAQMRLETTLEHGLRENTETQTQASAQAAQVFAHRLITLRAELNDAGLQTTSLAPMEQKWEQLRAQLSSQGVTTSAVAAANVLATQAEAVSTEVLSALDERLERLHLWLKLLGGALLLTLLVALRALFRQRHRLRQSLHQASDELGAGDWQEAVKTLRDERAGVPSAFDAFAVGVENALGQSERRWHALAELSADWYWETDEQGAFRWLSQQPSFLAEQAWTADDVLGRRYDQIPFFRPPSQGWHGFGEHQTRQLAFRDLEFQVSARRGNRMVWVSFSGRPQLDAQGKFIGYEGVGRDITERRDAQERLVSSEQRWSMMVGLASDWYWESDTEHRMLPLRPELRARYGALFEALEGRTLWDVYRDALSAEEWAEHRADISAHRPFRNLELEVALSDDKPLMWMSLSGIPRFDSQKRFRGYHGVGRDITAHKEAERLLLRHNDTLTRAVEERTLELQQVNLDLDAFARQLAHELRTPITHIQGLSSLLQSRLSNRISRDESELLGLQVQASKQMLATVEALMSLARSTIAPMPTDTVDLSAIALQSIAELPAVERRAQVRWQVQPRLQVKGSAAALKIVLTNLLGNAAKFTRGSASPLVCVEGELNGLGQWRISVKDNGVGFPPEKAEQLFRPFTRLHSHEEYAGTGIGLTIVQRIIERHGGTITAQPVPTGGACFELTLPCVDHSDHEKAVDVARAA